MVKPISIVTLATLHKLKKLNKDEIDTFYQLWDDMGEHTAYKYLDALIKSKKQ